MNWDAIGAVGEIVGAIAVLATLIYLATQVKQARDLAQFGAGNELVKKWDDLNKMLVSDPVTIELVSKFIDPLYEPKSKAEAEHLYSFANLLGNIWQSAERAYTTGHIDKAGFESCKSDVTVTLEKWPGVEPYLLLYLKRYPWTKELEIMQFFMAEITKQDGEQGLEMDTAESKANT